MLRKIAAVGATAAAIIGVGTAALATSGSSSTNGSGTSSANSSASPAKAGKHGGQAGKAGKRGGHALLRRTVHGSIVTKSKKDGFVVHSGIRGMVSSVSATSITVKAADGYSETFTLNKATRVRERPANGAKGKATAGTVSNLKQGDQVGVLGKAADKADAVPTATMVIDGLKK